MHRVHLLARLLVCLLFILFGPVAAAQILPITGSADEGTAAMPALETLDTGWWNYFDPTAENAVQNYQDFVAKTQAGLSRFSPKQRDEAERLLNSVENNLSIYRDLATADRPDPDPIPPASEEYSFEQLLRVLEGTRVAARQVADDELELNRAQRRLETDIERRDLAFRAYVAADKNDERWLAGLRLVQARLQQAVSELRAKAVEDDYKNARAIQSNFTDRLEYARERLILPAGDKDLATAQETVSQARKAYEKARAATEEAELAAAGFVYTDDVGKARLRVLQQRAMQSEVREAVLQLAFIQEEAGYWLRRLYSDNRPGMSSLKEKELEWSAVSERISDSRRSWQRDLEEEILLVQSISAENLEKKLQRLQSERLKLASETLSIVSGLGRSLQDFDFTLTVIDEVSAGRSSRISRWLGEAYARSIAAYQIASGLGNTTLFSIGETPIAGDDLLSVIWIILFAIIFSKLVRKGLSRVAGGDANNAGLYTFGRLFHYFIIFVAILLALASIGIDFSSLALVAGALGVGIGFGLQNIVNNFVSGLIILFEGTLRVGDYIELDTGVTGSVKAINARSTLITTNDNIDIIVPNAEIASNKLTNWTLGEYILRVRIPFGVAYGSDKDLVKKAALEAAENVHFTLLHNKGREPEVWLTEFGDSSLNFLLLVWVNRQGSRRPTRTLANYLWELDNAFAKYGITVPFPQRDLHLKSSFETMPAQDENT